MAHHLHIIDIGKDGINGHIVAKVKIIDDEDKRHGDGIPEIYAIDSLEIAKKYNGDVERWLAERVGPEMSRKHANRVAVHVDATRLVGKRIHIPNQAHAHTPKA